MSAILSQTMQGAGPSTSGSATSLFNPAGPAAAAAGGVVSGFGQIMQGIYGQQVANNRATQYEQQAQLDVYNASENVRQIGQKASSTISEANATAGASGVTAAGSPSIAIDATINNANAASTYQRYLGTLRKTSDLYQAETAKYEGRQSLFGGIIGGSTSILQGAATAAFL